MRRLRCADIYNDGCSLSHYDRVADDCDSFRAAATCLAPGPIRIRSLHHHTVVYCTSRCKMSAMSNQGLAQESVTGTVGDARDRVLPHHSRKNASILSRVARILLTIGSCVLAT